MAHLSFPDFDVQKIDFSQKDKILKIYVEGAWLDFEGVGELGKGVLFFTDWKNLSFRTFESEKWTDIDIENFEPLRDICEIIFSNSSVKLSGYTKYSGLWTEWDIQEVNMHAEFEKKN